VITLADLRRDYNINASIAIDPKAPAAE